MLAFHNGKERDKDDFVELLREADVRFHLEAIRQPAGSRLSLIEILWSG